MLLHGGRPLFGIPGLDERDAAFMQRLRSLAHEALSWPHLNGQQRLMWATVLELDVVPLQEQQRNLLLWVGWVGQFKEFAVIECNRQVVKLKLLGRNSN